VNILVTAGATREPIDGVRFISNLSSGVTGATLAASLHARGHRLAVLRGDGAAAPGGLADVEKFGSAADLGDRLRRRLATGEWDLVIMAAAVADYRPEEVVPGKLDSSAPELVLRLVRNPKLLPRLKSYAPRPLKVVGFKLTAGADEAGRRAAVAAQFAAGGVDAVVHNDLEEIRASAVHPFWFHRGPEAAPVKSLGAASLAVALEVWAAGFR